MVSITVPFNIVGFELSDNLDQCEPLNALYETVLPLTEMLPSAVPPCPILTTSPSSLPLFNLKTELPLVDAFIVLDEFENNLLVKLKRS